MDISLYTFLILLVFVVLCVTLFSALGLNDSLIDDEKATNPVKGSKSDADSIVLRDAFDDVLARIEPLEEDQSVTETRDQNPLPEGLARHLGPLIERAPSGVATAHNLATDTYRVALSPELLEGVQNGSLQMMKSREMQDALRLNVVTKGGKEIAGQGNLVPASEALQLASAGFQLASFATGQVHLAQINERLEELSEGIQDIKKHLENQQEGELLGKLHYLRRIANQIQNGSLADVDVATVNNQLETIERETLELGAAIQKEAQQRMHELDDIDLDTIMATAYQDASKLKDHSERCAETLRRYQLVFWVRLVTVELKTMLPVDQSILEERREDIRNDLREFQDLVEDHRARSLERTKDVTGYVRGNLPGVNSVERIRRDARIRIQDHLEPARQAAEQMSQTFQRGNNLLDERKSTLRNGVTVAVKRSSDGDIQAHLLEA
jgi:hypothetical protein